MRLASGRWTTLTAFVQIDQTLAVHGWRYQALSSSTTATGSERGKTYSALCLIDSERISELSDRQV